MVSYNKLIKIFSQWAAAHNQVKNFGAGERWQVTDHDQTASFKYPLMWVEDNSFNAAEREFTYGFTIWFVTRVESPADRGTDILFSEFTKAKSDMIGIAQDFIAYWIQDNDYPTIQLSESVSLDTFIETTPDRLTGCSIQVNFSDSFSYDNCIIPMDDMPTPPTSEVTVTVNGDSYFTLTCGSTGNVVVKDTDGNEVGSKIGNEWIVPAAGGGGSNPINITVNNTSFYTGVTTNQNVPVLDAEDNPIGSKIGSSWYVDSVTVNVNGDNIYNPNPETTLDLFVKNTNGDQVGLPAYPDTTVGDSQVEIVNSDASYSQTVDVVAEGVATHNLPDITVTINGSAQPASKAAVNLSFTATNIIYFRPESSGYGTTSYLTGDEGYNETNFPAPAAPAFGIPAFLDPTDPKKLLNNNVFGNKQRFTGINGGYYDYSDGQYKLANGTVSDQATTFGTTAANTSYLIDHHTGLGWKWNIQGVGTWSAKATEILGLSHAGFDDYFLPSRYQYRSLYCIFNLGTNLTLLVPFSSISSCKTSTPTFGSETTAHHQINGAASTLSRSDATSDAAYACRWHF